MKRNFNTYPRAPKTHVNSSGYRVYNNTGILVHRHMAEIKLGRPLNPCEVVHHIDRNSKTNKRIGMHTNKTLRNTVQSTALWAKRNKIASLNLGEVCHSG